ncbi:MAG: ribA/ribD-fused uncharacterized protein [Pseudohongiellaceae bacterium]
MLEHDLTLENALRFSRLDETSFLSTIASYPFELEAHRWPSAEHYYQAHKFEGMSYVDQILTAQTGQKAYELGTRRFKRKVKGWKDKRRVWMTRALYRITAEYPLVKQALLETGDTLLVETSLYNHYWGVGRDQRGENMLGKVWMDIRKKIQA